MWVCEWVWVWVSVWVCECVNVFRWQLHDWRQQTDWLLLVTFFLVVSYFLTTTLLFFDTFQLSPFKMMTIQVCVYILTYICIYLHICVYTYIYLNPYLFPYWMISTFSHSLNEQSFKFFQLFWNVSLPGMRKTFSFSFFPRSLSLSLATSCNKSFFHSWNAYASFNPLEKCR